MRVPKLRRNGDGRAFVEIPRSKGKRVYLGQYGSQEAASEYSDWIKRYVAGQYDPIVNSSAGLLLAEVIVKYLEHARGYYSRDGITTREYDNMKSSLVILAKTHGRLHADSFGPNELKAFRNHVSKQDEISRSYVNKHLSRVKRFIRWAEGEGYMPKGSWESSKVVEALRKGRTSLKETMKVRPVPLEDVRETMKYLNAVVRDMVQVQLLCGMRPQDVIGIRWEDIDQEGEIWFYTPRRHKNDYRDQHLIKAIPEKAQSILEGYRDRPLDLPIFSPKEAIRVQVRSVYGNKDVKVRKGVKDAYTHWSYGNAVKVAIRRANERGAKIEPWSPNQLRHSIGTYLRSRGNADMARAYLGHSDLNSTEVYAELDREAMEVAARIANQLL